MIYELGYLVVSSCSEENLAPEISKIKEALQKSKAEVISDEYPVLIDLAYTMVKRIDNKNKKFDTGYFGWIKFEVSADEVAKIKKALDRNDMILRFMIIQTVRENTIYSKKPFSSSVITRGSKSAKSVEEVTGEMDEEQIDSEIDKLVADPEEATEEVSAEEVL